MTPVVPIVLGVFVLVYLAFSALVAVLFFASVLLQHAFVLLAAGREQRGLRATLRLSCYAVGAPIALGWVPVVGLLAVFYCFYLYATALKRVHGISTGTTLGAVLVPWRSPSPSRRCSCSSSTEAPRTRTLRPGSRYRRRSCSWLAWASPG